MDLQLLPEFAALLSLKIIDGLCERAVERDMRPKALRDPPLLIRRMEKVLPPPTGLLFESWNKGAGPTIELTPNQGGSDTSHEQIAHGK